MAEEERKRIEQLEGDIVGLSLTLEALLSVLNLGDDFNLALKKKVAAIAGIKVEQVTPMLPVDLLPSRRGEAWAAERVLEFVQKASSKGESDNA